MVWFQGQYLKFMRQLIIWLVFSLLMPLTALAQSVAIKAGHVILPHKNKVLDSQIIIVEKNEIVRIGKNLDTTTVDKVIDLSDSWVMPGMMDCHVHLTSAGRYRHPLSLSLQTYVEESDSFRTIRGVKNAEILLNAGFTTVKEIGNDGEYITAGIIKAIEKGWIKGPTIYYAGKIIAPYGGQSSGINPANEGFWRKEYIDADNPDEIIKAVRKNIYYGANTIKMVAGNMNVGSMLDENKETKFTPYYDEEDIRAAVEEAAKVKAKVTVHVQGGIPARNVIMGGAAGIEHGMALENELLELMKEKGTFLVGTDLSYDAWYAAGNDEKTSKFLNDLIVDRLRRADKIGVKIAFGTDILFDLEGMDRAQSGLSLLGMWKDAGVKPMKVLRTMTSNAAELLGIEKSRGYIKEGFLADIIALKKNPLDDIDNVKSVHFVMKDGEIVRNSL